MRKTTIKKTKKPETEEVAEKYYEAVGRRKTATASVRLLTKGDKTFLINKKTLEGYFPGRDLQEICQQALEKMNSLDVFAVSVKVQGGGPHAQAEAIRHGISRALVLFNPDFRKKLKKAGFLKRDPRSKERKKPGLKRARKAPQWAKR